MIGDMKRRSHIKSIKLKIVMYYQISVISKYRRIIKLKIDTKDYLDSQIQK